MAERDAADGGAGGVYAALSPGIRLERYVIDEVLASGGFGVTYLATHETIHRRVVLKEHFPRQLATREAASHTIRPTDPGMYRWALDRFIEEARMLVRCKHAHIVDALDVFEANNTAYMVLSYEEGQSFDAWLKALGRPPSQAELDAIVGPLLDALAFVHENGLLHRDIAPDNIMIRTDGKPCLIDFGAARVAIGARSGMLTAIVKSGYSPIEQYQMEGRDQGPWTDIYALAGTLYRAVTGQRPIEATGRIMRDELAPAAAAALAPGAYRPGFLAAIDQGLKLHRDARPQSMEEFAAAMGLRASLVSLPLLGAGALRAAGTLVGASDAHPQPRRPAPVREGQVDGARLRQDPEPARLSGGSPAAPNAELEQEGGPGSPRAARADAGGHPKREEEKTGSPLAKRPQRRVGRWLAAALFLFTLGGAGAWMMLDRPWPPWRDLVPAATVPAISPSPPIAHLDPQAAQPLAPPELKAPADAAQPGAAPAPSPPSNQVANPAPQDNWVREQQEALARQAALRERRAAEAWERVKASEDVAAIRKVIADWPGTRIVSEAERRLAELDRQRREQEARHQAAAELWERIKSTTDLGVVERFIAAHATAPVARLAQERLAELRTAAHESAAAQAWERVAASSDETELMRFIGQYGATAAGAVARDRLAAIRAEALARVEADRTRQARDQRAAEEWAIIRDSTDPSLVESFIASFEGAPAVADAKKRLAELGRAAHESGALQAWQALRESNDETALLRMIEAYGDTPSGEAARQRLAALKRAAADRAETERLRQARAAAVWASIRNTLDVALHERFIAEHAGTPAAEEARSRLPATRRAAHEATAARAWEALKTTNDEAALREFVSRHGDTPSGEAARQRLAAIEKDKVAAQAPARPLHEDSKFVTALQTELKRLGCYRGEVDGNWGSGSRAALQEFLRLAGLDKADAPMTAHMDAARSRRARVCPLQCGTDEVEIGGRCQKRQEPKAARPAEAKNNPAEPASKKVAQPKPRVGIGTRTDSNTQPKTLKSTQPQFRQRQFKDFRSCLESCVRSWGWSQGNFIWSFCSAECRK